MKFCQCADCGHCGKYTFQSEFFNTATGWICRRNNCIVDKWALRQCSEHEEKIKPRKKVA